jgi:8-oxo-dGTP diphosphatase
MKSTKPYRLAVKAVIVDSQNRCLLIRRSRACHYFVGQWEWPGGKPDKAEDFTTALTREVREETSLEVEVCGLAGAAEFEMPAVHVILLCLEARRISGEIELSEEHDEFAWVPLSELPRWDLSTQLKPFMIEYAQRKGAEK